jgi:dTDP-4-amino-4,6-dideoxygalactose transaminase
MIPALDLHQQYLNIKLEIDSAIQNVLDSTQFILGREVKDLEERIAAYCECNYGIGVASGTDALRLSLAALDIGPDDEVITTPFTFVATANTVSHTGARPVFVDIDPLTYNLDPVAIEAAITPRTKAIVAVHLYGQSCDMDRLMEVANRNGLFVIEDCAQAIGARYKSKPCGSIGVIGSLSFFPSKNLGAYGDGGMVITNEGSHAETIDVLRRQGGKKKYFHEVLGFNSRLDAMQAAILKVKLGYLDEWNSGRRMVAHRYNDLLSGLPLEVPYESPDCYHVYHQYTIRTRRRDELAAYLKEAGIATNVYYPVPLHRQPLYAEAASLQLPHSEAAADEVLSLPIFPELTEQDQLFISDTIRSFFDRD